MLGVLHIIFTGQEADYQSLKAKIYQIDSRFSVSPWRLYPLADNQGEFNCSIDLAEREVAPLLDQLNNDWDGSLDECVCFGFNTKMFDPRVYKLEFNYYNK